MLSYKTIAKMSSPPEGFLRPQTPENPRKRLRSDDNESSNIKLNPDAKVSITKAVAGTSTSSHGNYDSFENLKSCIIRLENLDTIKTIIKRNLPKKLWELTDDQGYNMLHIATQFEYIDVIKYVMDELGINVNSKTSQDNTPLQIALYSHKKKAFFEIVKLLLEKGADFVSGFDEKNNTFVHLLPYYLNPEQYHEAVNLMIDLGHKEIFHRLNNLNQTPLHLAVEELDVSTETLKLVANSCRYDFNKPHDKDSGDSLLLYASRWGGSRKTLENLIEVGADWRLRNERQETALHLAVEGNNFDAIHLFISLGADVNARDALGRTPMHHIESHETESKKHYIELTKLLLEHGADIYAKDNYGETVANDLFSEASREDFEKWARFVVEIGHWRLFELSQQEIRKDESLD